MKIHDKEQVVINTNCKEFQRKVKAHVRMDDIANKHVDDQKAERENTRWHW